MLSVGLWIATAAPVADPVPRVTLGGMALDDTGLKSVVWVNNRGGSGVASGTTAWTIPNIPLQDGLNVITVTATDATGIHGTDAITVTEDMPPTVAASCSPCAASPCGVVTLTASAQDLNQDPLTYQWTAPTGSFAAGSTTPIVLWTAPAQPGVVVVTVTVSDGRGGSAATAVSIEVSWAGCVEGKNTLSSST